MLAPEFNASHTVFPMPLDTNHYKLRYTGIVGQEFNASHTVFPMPDDTNHYKLHR